jgi:hypothetical protein
LPTADRGAPIVLDAIDARASTSQFRFPNALQPAGTGTGKFNPTTIDCHARKAINERDRAYELAFGSSDSDLVKALQQSTQSTTNRAGQRLVERNLNVQPTITVRPGWSLRVIVHKDLVMRAYRGAASK